jgi:hypothetical protein
VLDPIFESYTQSLGFATPKTMDTK